MKTNRKVPNLSDNLIVQNIVSEFIERSSSTRKVHPFALKVPLFAIIDDLSEKNDKPSVKLWEAIKDFVYKNHLILFKCENLECRRISTLHFTRISNKLKFSSDTVIFNKFSALFKNVYVDVSEDLLNAYYEFRGNKIASASGEEDQTAIVDQDNYILMVCKSGNDAMNGSSTLHTFKGAYEDAAFLAKKIVKDNPQNCVTLGKIQLIERYEMPSIMVTKL